MTAGVFKVVEVHLDRSLPVLESCADADALLLIFRRRNVVLGVKRLVPENLPVGPRELAAIAAHATGRAVGNLLLTAGLPAPASRAAGNATRSFPAALSAGILTELDRIIARRKARPVPPVSASVVVCARQRPRPPAVRRCLAAVAGQLQPDCEIIVVHDGRDPEVEAAAREFSGVRCLLEARSGRCHARNAALRAATGDVVVFVDAEVCPEPGWLRALLQNFGESDVGVVLGLVVPSGVCFGPTASERVGELGGETFQSLVFDAGYAAAPPRWAPLWRIGSGANMAVLRQMALGLGGFTGGPGLGAAGGRGEDAGFWRRALHAGNRIIYDPLAIAACCHCADEHAAALPRRNHGASVAPFHAGWSGVGRIFRARAGFPFGAP